jgi:hypothetical protein
MRAIIDYLASADMNSFQERICGRKDLMYV